MPSPCTHCRASRVECRIEVETGKCSRCVGLGRTYDLILSKADWDRIEQQKDKIRKELDAVEDQMSETDSQLEALLRAQAIRRQKKLRLRKQLNLLTDREKSLWATDLEAIEALERVEYEAALRGEVSLPEGHPYEAALSRGFVVPVGEAPPSPSAIPSGSSNAVVDWSSDPLMLDPDSNFWKTVDFGGETGLATPSTG